MTLHLDTQTIVRNTSEETLSDSSQQALAAVVKVASNLETLTAHLTASHITKSDEPINRASAIDLAQSISSSRAEVKKILEEMELSEGPGLDILLDLFINEEAGRAVSITDACIAARCPPTTGLRWVKLLLEAQLIVKIPDPADQRRSFVALTAKGCRTTINCIDALVSV